MIEQSKIRNFVIIAHIDHGKSTLADRMLEITGTISREKIKPQMLDTMDLERERGITIKLQPVTMIYRLENSKHEILNTKQILNIKNQNNSNSLEIRNECLKAKQIRNYNDLNSKQVSDFDIRISDLSNSSFILNLIDTPGHVDFSYEVSRALSAVEGAVLLVDATKGIQAQTLANLYHAQAANLKIIPVVNKIDLDGADVEKAMGEIVDLLKIDPKEILKVSAKTGEGVEELLQKIINDVPCPIEGGGQFKALIFDSVYDSYRGAIAYIRVMEGEVKRGAKIKFMAEGNQSETLEVGKFKLGYIQSENLRAGEIGYLICGAKNVSEIKVGDTISAYSPEVVSPIAGFKIPEPMVYASIFENLAEPNRLRTSLEKLKLNDSSLTFTPENSSAFGQGFRCGFLGLLHLEIVKERLEREYDLDLIVTSPSVLYKTHQIGGKMAYEEPWVALEIITPKEYLGPVMELVQGRRGIYKNTRYLSDRVILEYDAPLSEIIVDFYDKLKSASSGYASQNYEIIEWREADLVKLDVLIAGEKIEEFSKIVPKIRLEFEAKKIATKLKAIIPRQMFEVAIQVTAGSKIVAREDISAMKKDVTAKLYGGDVTRKNKLLKKQAKGKKKMKMFGRVEIPSNVFLEVLKS